MKKMKKSTKWILISTAIALSVGLLVVGLGKVTLGFQNWNTDDWSLRQNNPDNLYHSANFLDDEGTLSQGADGITAEMNTDDHTIKVRGSAEKDVDVGIAVVSLKAGTYVFDGGLSNGSNKTAYVQLTNVSGGAVLATSYNGPVVFEVETDVQANLVLHVAEEASVNTTLKPIICLGEKTGDLVGFYK